LHKFLSIEEEITNGDLLLYSEEKQGERVELEITVNNKGKLEAMNTMLKVTTSKPMVRIEPESKSIGTLPENTTSDPMRFTLTIPRGVEAGALPTSPGVSTQTKSSPVKRLFIHNADAVFTTDLVAPGRFVEERMEKPTVPSAQKSETLARSIEVTVESEMKRLVYEKDEEYHE